MRYYGAASQRCQPAGDTNYRGEVSIQETYTLKRMWVPCCGQCPTIDITSCRLLLTSSVSEVVSEANTLIVERASNPWTLTGPTVCVIISACMMLGVHVRLRIDITFVPNCFLLKVVPLLWKHRCVSVLQSIFCVLCQQSSHRALQCFDVLVQFTDVGIYSTRIRVEIANTRSTGKITAVREASFKMGEARYLSWGTIREIYLKYVKNNHRIWSALLCRATAELLDGLGNDGSGNDDFSGEEDEELLNRRPLAGGSSRWIYTVVSLPVYKHDHVSASSTG